MAEIAERPKLLSLEGWARKVYGDKVPHINTLYRWVRDAKIIPAPKKHGRNYYVEESAQYVDWAGM